MVNKKTATYLMIATLSIVTLVLLLTGCGQDKLGKSTRQAPAARGTAGSASAADPADSISGSGSLAGFAGPIDATSSAGPAAGPDPAGSAGIAGSASPTDPANSASPADPAGSASPTDSAGSASPADPANSAGLTGSADSPPSHLQDTNLNMAVEYTAHAASFYFARAKNLFSEKGININDTKVYASGVGVAAAFTKGGFDASYMCLVPAIFTYANGGVPLQIIAGTHKDGYGLVVNAAKIKELRDLEKNGIKIANGPLGTTTDFMQMLLLAKENLDAKKIMANTVRMNAAKQLMALRHGKVDAVFVPEHFATLAASFPGMQMLLGSADIWPDMPGSVLVVTQNLFDNNPAAVKGLKEINEKSIALMRENPHEAAKLVAQSLNLNQGTVKEETQSPEANLAVTPEIALQSMRNLKLTPDLNLPEVQAVIDEMYAGGYLTKSFAAKEIMAIDFVE